MAMERNMIILSWELDKIYPRPARISARIDVASGPNRSFIGKGAIIFTRVKPYTIMENAKAVAR